MCTMWIDGFNGVAHHPAQNVDFAIAAAADPPALRAHARSRGWRNLWLLSCGESTFKYDLGSEDADGEQDSAISVFTRDGEGTMRHFYTTHPRMAENIDQRGIDLLCPVWHVLDLTPQGRDDWYAELAYGAREPDLDALSPGRRRNHQALLEQAAQAEEESYLVRPPHHSGRRVARHNRKSVQATPKVGNRVSPARRAGTSGPRRPPSQPPRTLSRGRRT